MHVDGINNNTVTGINTNLYDSLIFFKNPINTEQTATPIIFNNAIAISSPSFAVKDGI